MPAPHWLVLLGENSLFKTIGDIFHPLFIAVASVLAFIYGIVPNYLLAIVLLTILIMALLTPLTIKSTRSMVAMQALQPELQKLRQKYKGAENREQLNREMMALYKEHGVSPTGGCLPMFLQMPALIVLYDVIRGIANTVNVGQKYPAGTVYRLANGQTQVANASTVCNAAHGAVKGVCAVPRYIPTGSRMYHDLIASPGVLKAFGLNLASKPLSHHTFWYDYIPYFIFVGLAVALQYIQMSQMTKRNKAAAQMNPQMQTMQKVMPLIFAYIYFIVPAGVVVYMIVSSAIRILTQDLIFRHGLVQAPRERQIGGTEKPSGSPKPGGPTRAGPTKAVGPSKAAGPTRPGGPNKAGGASKAGGPSKGAGVSKAGAKAPSEKASTGAPPPAQLEPADGAEVDTAGGNNGKQAGGTGSKPRGARPGGGQRAPGGPAPRPGAGGRGGGSGNGSGRFGRRNGAAGKGEVEEPPAPKAHPRSKSKRERKAR